MFLTSSSPTAMLRAVPTLLRGLLPVGTGQGSGWSSSIRSDILISHLDRGCRNLGRGQCKLCTVQWVACGWAQLEDWWATGHRDNSTAHGGTFYLIRTGFKIRSDWRHFSSKKQESSLTMCHVDSTITLNKNNQWSPQCDSYYKLFKAYDQCTEL